MWAKQGVLATRTFLQTKDISLGATNAQHLNFGYWKMDLVFSFHQDCHRILRIEKMNNGEQLIRKNMFTHSITIEILMHNQSLINT